MKNVYQANKHRKVQQGGKTLIVCGYSHNQVIGATEVQDNRTWKELDFGSYVNRFYDKDKFYYEYINEELLRFEGEIHYKGWVITKSYYNTHFVAGHYDYEVLLSDKTLDGVKVEIDEYIDNLTDQLN